jgi:macrolide transport system ATP-binding/permease protein
MRTFLQDLRYGARMLVKNPGFTLIVVITLALGIGANTAIFTWFKAFFLHPLPGVASGHRLVTLHSVMTRSGNRAGSVSYPDYKDYRDRNEVFSGLAVYNLTIFNLLAGDGQPERVGGSLVSGNYFDVLGVPAALGRTFAPDEDRTPGTHPVAVISHSLWQRRFAADPNVIGKTIQLNRHNLTVIGVAAEGFGGSVIGLHLDLWAPMMMTPQLEPAPEKLNGRDTLWLSAIGRLKGGVAFEQAQTNVQNIAAQLARDYPQTNEGTGATLFRLARGADTEELALSFAILMAVAGLVLLIACANVVNLLLARGAGRSREIGVRIALGAGRSRLIRQMLTESLLLAVLGGACGALLAAWLSDAMSLMLPTQSLPISLNLAWDYRVSGFASGLTLLAVVAVGLVPALRATKVDPIASIKNEAGVTSALMRRSRFRGALVVIQIAVSLVSLLCAGLFIRTLAMQTKVNLGFNTERALLVSMELFGNGYDEKRGEEFYRQLVARVEALPGVESASLSTQVPPLRFGGRWRNSFEIEGYAPRTDEMISFEIEVVAPRYFQTMRIPLAEGREFSEADHDQSGPVVIVNETLARRYWPGQSPVGKRLRMKGETWETVIGVARDAKYFGPREPVQPWIYYPHAQKYESGMTLVARTTGDPWQSLAGVRGAVHALDAALPLYDEKTLATHCGLPLFWDRLVVVCLSAFGLLALTLSTIGLYGVIAYSVTARTREIGIRMALGAQMSDVLKQVIKQGMILTLIGGAIGLAASFALTRLMESLLFGVSATDPVTFTLVSLLLAAVALFACWIPARRATKVDPMAALRVE